jgi:hypothetical protein
MPTFSYNLNIPAAADSPSADQPLMEVNTNSINSIIGIDHFAFQSAGAQDGYHKQVSLVNESAPGVPVNANGVLYANLINSNSWPLWQNALGSVALMSQVSSAAANGYVSLPAGVLLQWGSSAVNSSGTLTTITFPIAFPTNCFSVVIGSVQSTATTSPSANNVYLTSTAPTTTQFVVSNSSSGTLTKIFWVAVGN